MLYTHCMYLFLQIIDFFLFSAPRLLWGMSTRRWDNLVWYLPSSLSFGLSRTRAWRGTRGKMELPPLRERGPRRSGRRRTPRILQNLQRRWRTSMLRLLSFRLPYSLPQFTSHWSARWRLEMSTLRMSAPERKSCQAAHLEMGGRKIQRRWW